MKDYYKVQRVKTKNKNSPSKGLLMQCAPRTNFLWHEIPRLLKTL